MRLQLLLCLSICFISHVSFSQTTIVQTLTYDSTSRAMMVDFPIGDHHQYEKIIMHYGMRCKDGLVSTGADRNRGCGEWDYSCNTYITDSTRVDSLKTTSPSHIITGYNESMFDYVSSPTYTYYQSELQQVSINSVNSENEYVLDAGVDQIPQLFGNNISERKSQFLYKANDLTDAGLDAGNITGLKFSIASGTGIYQRFKIKMLQTDISDLTGNTLLDGSFVEVFYDDVEIISNEAFFTFHQAFVWDGVSNIIIEFSYSSATDNGMMIEGGNVDYVSSVDVNGDEDVAFFSDGTAVIDLDSDLNFQGDELSIAFWYLGGDGQPQNSTMFEGLDSLGQRQVNVHLPWGDGNVYWDCGNNGSGYDRISKFANETLEIKKWNHWTFTKNTVSGFMRIYLNGEPWSAGINKKRPINIKSFRLASSMNGQRRNHGTFDSFKFYNKELTQEEIYKVMSQKVVAGQDLYDHLILAYDFNNVTSGQLTDLSSSGINASTAGPVYARNHLGRQLFKEARVSSVLPDITFVRGDYNQTITSAVVRDSLKNFPYEIREYEIVNGNLVIKDDYEYYLAGFQVVYDDQGEVIDGVLVNPEGTINIEQLEYFTKRPSKFEIMSFVTPYGIGIDFGLEGKTWTFDVTDFAPILKGRKLLTMERGGQFQEEMDIKFEFVEGTPIRYVENIQQVWPVTHDGYTRIQNDDRYEEKIVKLSESANQFALKASVTGHGQEGEFIPQIHYLNVNEGPRELEWQVWKECADNAIYPQGGTWIYDRAGWCPGAPTDIQTLPLDDVSAGDEIAIDYGVNGGSGDSRYIVNVQLVSYSEPNFDTDAELMEIINPSQNPAHERFNPMCGVPRIKIRNTGKNELTTVQIAYGVEGRSPRTFNWTGNLSFMEETEVALLPLHLDPSVNGAEFFARIENANGIVDDYENNNEKSSLISTIPVHKKDVIIEMRTNNRPQETSWKFLNESGVLIEQRGGGLSANTTYRDTLTNLHGCYRLLVEDSDQDGISWWANNDGNGYVQIRDIGGGITPIATDFGMFVQYEFVTEGFVPTANINPSELILHVYPNPGPGLFTLSVEDNQNTELVEILDSRGQVVYVIKDATKFSEEYKIDLSSMSAGIYFAKVTTKDNSAVVQFVKY